MKAVVALALAACGGSKPSPAPPPAPPPAKPAPRIQVEEPEPDDGVSVKLAHGHMEPEVVQAGIAPHAEEFTDCYAARVGKRRWLGGHVTMHWNIRADGEVTKVVLAESDLGSWPVEKCLLEVAHSARFGKPVGGNADFVVPLDFKAMGGSMPWDEDRGIKAVGKQLATLAKCTKKRPADEVVITMYVGPHGQAQSVGFSAKAVIDDVWGDCAEKLALAWKLPDPRGTVAKLAIRYRP